MSYSWRTKADVLNDLGTVNGRRMGAEQLDLHVVEGERPPPIHREVPDEEEMTYFFGRHGGPTEDNRGPDLAGISVMLKMVENMNESEDTEPMTFYHNQTTDEIRISKLNPLAGEYVPGDGIVPNPRSPRKPKRHTESKEDIPRFQNIKPLPNMFRRRSEKKAEEGNTNENLEKTNAENKPPNAKENNVLRNHISQLKTNLLTNGLPQRKSDDMETDFEFSKMKQNNVVTKELSQPNSLTNGLRTRNMDEAHREKTPSNDSSQSRPKLLLNGLPKRRIEKSLVSPDTSDGKIANKDDEIREIQEKIKSSLIASSNDNSIDIKRQKNVAIATLLKLGGIVPPVTEKPVKLLKPDYFENPPEKETSENQVEKEPMPSSFSSEMDKYIDPDSITKVNGWFNTIESPKPKPQCTSPLVLKPSVAFKKKECSSVNSRSSESIKEIKQPIKKFEKKSFKPSSHASDLLKKYESNAERAPLKEDLGTRLERMLKEKDEIIKQKILARQNAG